MDPIATPILLSIAADIIEHQAKHLDRTFVGNLLKWGGIIEPDFIDRLRETVKQALQLLFNEHPEYNLTGVVAFFRDPTVTQAIGNYILDRQPIDERQVEQALNKHLMQDPISVFILRDNHVVPQNIIPNFLACYRRVLNMQLSVSEMSLLLEIIDQSDRVLVEIKGSEARMKAYIDELKNTKLSPQALQAASQVNQQEGTEDLIQNLDAAKLIQPDEAVLTIQKRLKLLPSIFTEGLCKGRALHAAPHEYFVSHGFQPNLLVDWRRNLTKSLAKAGNAQETLTPYFQGDTLLGGYRLCGICEKLYSSRFSIFLLPPDQDRNVYLELGIAIGMGAPFLLIQPRGAQLPDVLEGLIGYISNGLFRTIQEQLPGKIGKIEEYNFAVVSMVRKLPVAGSQPKYLIGAGKLYDDLDFEGTIDDTMKAAYPNIEAISLREQTGTADAKWEIEQLIDAIQTTRFAIYRVNEECSTTTFLALGISIALNRPFFMIRKSDSNVPLDLRGIGMYRFENYSALEDEFVTRHQVQIERLIK